MTELAVGYRISSEHRRTELAHFFSAEPYCFGSDGAHARLGKMVRSRPPCFGHLNHLDLAPPPGLVQTFPDARRRWGDRD